MKIPTTRERAIRNMLRGAASATNKKNAFGYDKTDNRHHKPRPITLPKLAFLGETVTESDADPTKSPS